MSLSQYVEALQWRYATKQFDPSKKLDEGTLELLLESLRLSPSSFGLQPWKFFVISDPKIRAELKPHSWNQPQITDASHLIVIAHKKSIDASYINEYAAFLAKERGVSDETIDGYRNIMLGFLSQIEGEAGKAWMAKQTYIALGNLLSACAVAQVDACPMEGFDAAAYDRVLGFEKLGITASVLCPVGYRSASDGYAKLKKVRFPSSLIVERR